MAVCSSCVQGPWGTAHHKRVLKRNQNLCALFLCLIKAAIYLTDAPKDRTRCGLGEVAKGTEALAQELLCKQGGRTAPEGGLLSSVKPELGAFSVSEISLG